MSSLPAAAVEQVEQDSVRRLVWQATLLRVALAIAIHFTVAEEFFAPDQGGYHNISARLAAWWSGKSATYPMALANEGRPAGYYYLVASLYTLVGTWRLLPKILNGIVGGITVRLTYSLARKVIGAHQPALFAARVCAFLPSMVLWSALNIRDVWVILIILVACNATLDLQQRFSPTRCALLAAALMALLEFRAYLLFAVAGPIVVGFLAQRSANMLRNATLGLLASVVLVFGDMTGGDRRAMRSADLEIMQEFRESTAHRGESNFAPDADISTVAGAAVFLPLGLAFFLFAPFPWMISGLRQLITLPEMLFLYSLVPAMAVGAVTLIRKRRSESLVILLIAGALTFGYALGQSNAGTAYRHRAQVLPFLMVLAGAGRATRRESELLGPSVGHASLGHRAV